MNLTEMLIAVAVMTLIAGTGWLVRQHQVDGVVLAADLAAVQGVARAHARAHCARPPPGPVRLDVVLTGLRRTAAVRDPEHWSIVLSLGTGPAGVGARIRYATSPDSPAARYLLQQPGARWQPGCCVELPVSRPTVGPQRSSFQFLFDGATC